MLYLTDEEAAARRNRFRQPTPDEIAEMKRREAQWQAQKERLKLIKPAPPLWISMHISTERERRAKILFSSEGK